VCVCGSVCYNDNSKLRASILTKLVGACVARIICRYVRWLQQNCDVDSTRFDFRSSSSRFLGRERLCCCRIVVK